MSPSILIVDDCVTTRKLVGLYLRQGGYDSIHAENGLEALEKLAQEAVELVITDVNMPGMDGVELTRSMKNDDGLKDIPVLMLTTEAGDKERGEGLAAGVQGYLTKPVTQTRLIQEVERLLLRTDATQP